MRRNILKKKFTTLLIILFSIILVSFFILIIFRKLIFPREYEHIVNQAAEKYNVDPNLIYAIIKQESKFNENAISKSGAKGLMQILDSTAEDMVKQINTIDPKNYNIFDPYTNIFIGTKYVSYLTKYFDGNYYLAIIAYNAGMGNIQQWLDKPYTSYTDYNQIYSSVEYVETRTYLNNVVRYYNYYTILYN